MKWNEVAKLKSDMMQVHARWGPHRVPADALRAKCREAGLSAEDTDTVTELLGKAQAGRRVVSERSYRDSSSGRPRRLNDNRPPTEAARGRSG